MPGHDIVVVGASAGGVEALSQLVRGLPPEIPAAIFVVLHTPPSGTSVLPRILSRAGRLPAAHARNGEPIETGRIYVAPPDHHLLLQRGFVRLARGPRENSNRPAVDPLFRTAARAYGGRVVGVVLSGTLDDGTAGLIAIKRRGGVAVVQDPNDALFSGMPHSAIDNVEVDHVVPIAFMADLLDKLAREPVEEAGEEAVPDDMEKEAAIEAFDLAAIENHERPGIPSTYACPECGGTLWELEEGELTRFRCRVGHAFSPDSLLAEQSDALETALWSAFRALEETAALAERMALRAKERDRPYGAERFNDQARDARERAALIREVLLKGQIDAASVTRSSSSESEANDALERHERMA
jgi:two-component system, chemotaxis family, protein-glutamate methylesterase/glutaminase